MATAESTGAPQKAVVVEAIVLVFQHSPLREVVGTDALRSVLDVEYRELTASGTLELQPVWELLAEQPGFDSDAAAAAFCRLKLWERDLGLEVTLPGPLAELAASERARLAAECPVPPTELRKLVRGGDPEPAPRRTASGGEAVRGSPRHHDARRGWVLPVAAAVALLGFGAAGVSIYRGCTVEPKWESVTAESFRGELPIANAQRIGKQVGATLTDESWLDAPEDRRRAQLASALDALRPAGVEVLFLRDGSQQVRAIAQRARDEIQFTFP